MRVHLEVLVRRGEIVESRHRLELAHVDARGRLLTASEHPQLVTTFRSSAKPFQLLPLVERGHAERWGFSDEQLAVMAASHVGSAYHLALVRSILERIGLGAEHLVCGFHEPEDAASLAALRGGSASPSPLYNNCSGKHAGLLALARAENWPVEGYHRPAHPVQQLLHRTVAEVCSVAPESMGTAVDGCSLVVFALPLAAMARGYAVLAAAAAQPGGDARTRALARIARAMTAYPRAVEGPGRLSTELMEATAGRSIAKGGAEGLQLVGLTDRGEGLAIKCEDGAQRAIGPAVTAVLEQLGALTPPEVARLAAQRIVTVRNAAGLEVGSITAGLEVVALT
ncbi:MAG TPA: asparaginase [Candidatus Acidoferrales bacterium]|nr:asparaginase [Candidatus Acidoferrales bacterium]